MNWHNDRSSRLVFTTRNVSVLSLDGYCWRSSYEVNVVKFGPSWSMWGHFLTVRSYIDWLIYLLRQFCRLCRRLSIDKLINMWRIVYEYVSLTVPVSLVLFSATIGIDDNIDIKFDAYDSRDWRCYDDSVKQITMNNWEWSISVNSQSFTLFYAEKLRHILRTRLLFSQYSECVEFGSSILWQGLQIAARFTSDEVRLLLQTERCSVSHSC